MQRLLCLAALSLCLACGDSEDAIRQEIQAANTCTVPADCVNVGSYCPFGCNVLVNRSQADSIRARLQSYSGQTCAYDCRGLLGIGCTDRRCAPIYE